MEKYIVKTLGTFSIQNKSNILHFHDYNSEKITKLLSLLIRNRDKKIYNYEIADIVFKDDDSTDPINALKALFYRARKILKDYLGDESYICSSKGCYYWNDDIEVEVDSEVFEDYISKGTHEGENDKKYEFYAKAIEIYNGHFMPMLAGEAWVAMEDSYLESQAASVLTLLTQHFFDLKDYPQFKDMVYKLIAIDPYNEIAHCLILTYLFDTNNEESAFKHYDSIRTLFKEELGAEPGIRIKKIMDAHEQIKESMDMKAFLLDDDMSAAFKCSPMEFKKFFQLELRRSQRDKTNYKIIVIQLIPKSLQIENKELRDAIIKSAISLLMEAVLSKLRAGDCVTRFGKTQIYVLLNCEETYIHQILCRIKETFYCYEKYHRVELDFHFQPIENFVI